MSLQYIYICIYIYICALEKFNVAVFGLVVGVALTRGYQNPCFDEGRAVAVVEGYLERPAMVMYS